MTVSDNKILTPFTSSQSPYYEFKPLLNVIAPRKTHGQDGENTVLEGCATARYSTVTNMGVVVLATNDYVVGGSQPLAPTYIMLNKEVSK